MKRSLLSFLGCFTLVACAPSVDELAKNYIAAPAAYEQLAEMIKKDTGAKACLSIGLDRIGAYRRRSNGEWSAGSSEPVDLAKVLHELNITEARYEGNPPGN